MQQINLSKNTFITLFSLALLIAFTNCEKNSAEAVSSISIEDFEMKLEILKKQSNIPGMIAGIVRDGKVIWIKPYGYENLAKQKPVTSSTIFQLASLTKTFASTVIMQLVGENKINLSDPVAKYGILLNEKDTVRVIHLLTHTSEGVPGNTYRYNGDRYSLLSTVIQIASGHGFDRLATEKIMLPLGLQNTAPSDMRLAAINGFDTIRLKQNTAQGYHSDGNQPVDYPRGFSTAAGLISTMDDMLKYAAAYEGNQLLSDAAKTKVFAPWISNSGKTLPYGLGWFVQQRESITIDWHYGYWTGMSSLMIRVPDKKLSFVIMANSDKLSSPYPLGNGEIWVSPYAQEFLKSFVLNGAKL